MATQRRWWAIALVAVIACSESRPKKRVSNEGSDDRSAEGRDRGLAKEPTAASATWVPVPAGSDPIREGLRGAVQHDKPFVYLVSAPSCEPCSIFEQRVQQPEIQALIAQAVASRVVLDSTDLDSPLSIPPNLLSAKQKRWIKKVPDLVCMYAKADGRIEAEHTNGDQDVEDIKNALERCLRGHQRSRDKKNEK